MSKRTRDWTRRQRQSIRLRTIKPKFGCSQCRYRSVCWDGLCLRCLNNGFIGPNEKEMRQMAERITEMDCRIEAALGQLPE